MLRERDIVCFSSDWSGDPTSKKHIMSRLARGNRVLWIDSIGCRRPRATASDARRIVQKLAAFGRGCRPVAENVWALSPPALPFHASPAAQRANRLLLASRIRLAMRRLGMHDVLSWSFVPSSAVVAGALRERLLIYHCVDEYSEFTGVDAPALLRLEARLAGRADVVFVTAERLLKSKRVFNRNTFLVRHGVDVDHFGRALDPETAIPPDLLSGPGPVVGFFGLVADWVDLELVAHLARRRPDWQVVLIGPVVTSVAPLAGLANVRLLGRRPYAELPSYCKGFDAAILPFRINELTLAVNPLKLREYLAAGLPVVATPLPEVERYRGAVALASDRDAFLAAVEAAVAPENRGPRASRVEAVRDESWDAKTEELSAIVQRFLAASESRGARRPARSLVRPPAGELT